MNMSRVCHGVASRIVTQKEIKKDIKKEIKRSPAPSGLAKNKSTSAAYYAVHPEKRREHSATYRAKHPEKVRASRRKWVFKNHEKVRAYQRQYLAAFYAAHPEKRREYQATYLAKHPEKRSAVYLAAHPEKRREYNATYYAKHPEKVRAGRAAWKKRHGSEPEVRRKILVREATNNAIQSGKLIRQPCERCGQPAEAHHDDYSRTLDVRWLCRTQHVALHQEENRRGRNK